MNYRGPCHQLFSCWFLHKEYQTFVTSCSVCRCTHELTDTTCSVCRGSMHCIHTQTDIAASQVPSHVCDLTVCSCRWWTGTMHLSKRASGLQDRLGSRCAEKRHSRQLGCGPKHVRQSKLKELSSKLTCKEKGAHACPQCQHLDCTVIRYVNTPCRATIQGKKSYTPSK